MFLSRIRTDRKCEDPMFRMNTFLIFIILCIVSLLSLDLFLSFHGEGIPKTAELKIYAFVVCAAAVWFFIAVFFHHLLSKDCPFSWMFFFFYFPLVALANVYFFDNIGITTLLAIFGAAGLELWICECMFRASGTSYPWVRRFILIGIALSVVLTVYYSVGNTFHFLSLTTPLIMGGAWLLIEKVRFPFSDRMFGLIVSLTIIPLFFLERGSIDTHHYSFVLGPVIEQIYGHSSLVQIAPQYGPGLTVALAWYLSLAGHITNAGLLLLLRCLTYIQFLLIFFVSWSLTRSRALAVCTLAATLMFNYFSQGGHYFSYPVTGFLRFGFPLVIVALFCMPGKHFQENYHPHLVAFLTAIASFWSFESMIYTVPAVIASTWINRRLWYCLQLSILYILAMWEAYWIFLLLNGHIPDLFQFVEYPLLYANGLSQLPLIRQTTLWWLFPPIALYGIARSFWDRHADERVALLSVYALALFTYFGGRAHPNNLHHVSIPFILLLFHFISRIASRHWKNAIAVLVLTAFACINMSHFEQWPVQSSMLVLAHESVDELRGVLPKPVYDDCRSFDGFCSYVHDGQLALLDSADGTYNVFACCGAANAFAINPFKEIEDSPRAVERVATLASTLPEQPVLVADDTADRPLTVAVLNNLVLGEGMKVTIAGKGYQLYVGRGTKLQ